MTRAGFRPIARRPRWAAPLRHARKSGEGNAFRRAWTELFALLALAAGMIAMSGLPRMAMADQRVEGTVVRIVDGDTFYLSGVDTRIRLWGVDAPERSASGGAEATRALAELTAGRRIVCKHVDTDRYGRIVGQCFLPSGEDVAALMIARGAAREYFRYSGGYYSVHGFVERTFR